MSEKVVLVDKNDIELGLEDKLVAHQGKGKLHRAISVLLFDGDKLLLQQRSESKPLWPLYWSNSCCTHPRPGEGYLECAKRRVKEELRIGVNDLQVLDRFVYRARFSLEWAENEVDTVIIGKIQSSQPKAGRPLDEKLKIEFDPREVAAVRWVRLGELTKDLGDNPGDYTPWLRLIWRSTQNYFKK